MEDLLQVQAQGLAQDHSVDTGMGHHQKGLTGMVLEQFRQLGRHPGLQVLEALAGRDAEIGQVREALLQFFGGKGS